MAPSRDAVEYASEAEMYVAVLFLLKRLPMTYMNSLRELGPMAGRTCSPTGRGFHVRRA